MRRSPSRLLRRSLLAIALMALLPVPITRAADIQPTVTMDPIDPIVYRGGLQNFVAHISDGAPFGVTFEWSSDGTTWQSLSGSNQSGGDPFEWHGGTTVDGSMPLGISYVRAHYPGSPGYLPADSAAQSREIRIRQASISNFYATNPNQNIIVPGTNPVRIFATFTDGVGTIDRFVDGAWTTIAGPMGGLIWTDIGPLGEGDHTFRANIAGTDYYLGATQELTLQIVKGPTEPIWNGDLTVQANHPLPVIIGLNGQSGGPSLDGQVTVKDVASDSVIASGSVGLQFTIPGMTVGTHQFLVSYLGSDDYAASSKMFAVVVTADSADATGVGTNYTTFYPYKDGYRDTVSIKGARLEPLSVWIRVYSPTNKLVKSVTLPRAGGSYGYAWNGRNSAGTMLASGKYKVVQVLADANGARKTVTSYVTLSSKRLVTKTTYVTKLGSSISASGDPGSGSIARSTSGGYTRLTAKYPSGWVGVGYQFALPSATVYKSIAFQVDARGPLNVPPTYIGVQNFSACPYNATWYEGCFDHWKTIGHAPLATLWYSTSGSATTNRYGRTVRGMVSCYSGTYTIYKTRVKVVYGVLQ